MPDSKFLDLLQRAQSGDETAWTELVSRIEPFIERVVRFRMRRRGDFDRLRPGVGASDIRQSVLTSFFKGLRENRWRLDKEEDLTKLLYWMIRINLATKARKSWVRFRELFDENEIKTLIDPDSDPELPVIRKDMVEAIQSRFSSDELEILTQWLDDAPWDQIAANQSLTLSAARQRLARAFRRVREEVTARDDEQ